jgi:hypothetical protein
MEPLPEESSRPYDARWAKLFLAEARPLQPDDHLVSSARYWLPSPALVVAVVVLDLILFAYAYSQI